MAPKLLARAVGLALLCGCNTQQTMTSAPEAPISWVDGTNRFGFDLYRQVAQEQGNLVYSPAGLGTTLALVALGAEEETLQAFKSVAHLPPATYLPSPGSLVGTLKHELSAQSSLVTMSSSLWVKKGVSLTSAYKDAIGQIGMAKVEELDFGDSAQALGKINSWAADHSNGRIKQLLQSNDLDSSTRMVVADLVYLKAAWRFPFDPSATKPASFRREGLAAVDVPMMEQVQLLNYAKANGVTWVELPYVADQKGGRELVMMVVMPDGKLADLESTWSKQTLQAGLQQLHPTQIRLRMPQWKISRRENWNTVLKRIGLGVAFSDKANFAGIDGAQDLALGQVVEQSWISVDEMGTEASSASAATLIVKGIREEPTEVSINRPFLFLIYDRASDQILFMGRVVDPTAESR